MSQTWAGVFKGISMREVTGFLTDDGAFYESMWEAETHEATYALTGAFKQYVGESGNVKRFQNVITNLAPEIRRYLNAIEGPAEQSETISEVDQATIERETRHKPPSTREHTPNDGLGSALEDLEQQQDRGPVHVPNVGDRAWSEEVQHRREIDGPRSRRIDA